MPCFEVLRLDAGGSKCARQQTAPTLPPSTGYVTLATPSRALLAAHCLPPAAASPLGWPCLPSLMHLMVTLVFGYTANLLESFCFTSDSPRRCFSVWTSSLFFTNIKKCACFKNDSHKSGRGGGRGELEARRHKVTSKEPLGYLLL